MPSNCEKSSDSKASIRKVAHIAGVSIGTVSRVFNESVNVNATTRKHVLEVARGLNFRPRMIVRPKQIVLVTQYPRPLASGFVATFVEHVAYAATQRQVALRFVSEDNIININEHMYDGVLAIVWRQEAIERLMKFQRIPVVFVNKMELADSHGVVSADHEQSGYIAAEHFLKNGKKRLAFLTRVDNWSAQQRLAGYCRAIRNYGADVDERLFIMQSNTPLHARLNTLVQAGADAMFLPDDETESIEAMQILQDSMCLRIPQDIALIGSEKEGISCFLRPAMTTISQPIQKLGELALKYILQLCANKKTPPPPLLEYELISRCSVTGF